MSRPIRELDAHVEILALDLEATERATFQRRMLPTLELELITMRAELKYAKGIDR